MALCLFVVCVKINKSTKNYTKKLQFLLLLADVKETNIDKLFFKITAPV